MTQTKEDPKAARTAEENGHSETVVDVNIDDILTESRDKFVQQMEQLRPAHEAYVRLEGIVANFDQVASGEPLRGRRRGTSATGRASRGSRPEEFLGIIRASGEEGITVSEAGERMGVNPNYLYRLAKDLTEDGAVRKEGKRYYVTA